MSVLGQMFKGDVPVTGEEVERKFRAMTAGNIGTSMKILEPAYPQIAKDAQAFYLSNWIERAKVPGPADSPNFISARMTDMLNPQNRPRFNAMFPDPQVRAQVENGIKAAQRVMMNNFTTGGRNVAKMKEFSRNIGGIATGRPSGIFLTAMAAELFVPDRLGRYLLTPDGIKALQTLAGPFNQNRWSAAIATLQSLNNNGSNQKMQQ